MAYLLLEVDDSTAVLRAYASLKCLVERLQYSFHSSCPDDAIEYWAVRETSLDIHWYSAERRLVVTTLRLMSSMAHSPALGAHWLGF